MKIQLNLDGRTRREAAECVADALRTESEYSGAPSFNYRIGTAVIDRNCVLIMEDGNGCETIIAALHTAGFCENIRVIPEPDDPCRLTVSMPIGEFTDKAIENLRKLVKSKANVIKKALGTEDLTVIQSAGSLDFPWFTITGTNGECVIYSQFISKLCGLAKQLTRVNATEKPIGNEKRTFRHFLLRLGYIGKEFAADRKFLMRNLDGSSAHKGGDSGTTA
jgi:hypothetical protein